jgi:hypothetical protein
MKHFDDDMDELFNKAGRHYPLKTEPNWVAVRNALLSEDGVASGQVERKSYRRFLPLLLLFFLTIPAYVIFTDNRNVNDKLATRDQKLQTTGGNNSASDATADLHRNETAIRQKNNLPSVTTQVDALTNNKDETGSKASVTDPGKNIRDHELSYVPPAKHSLNNAQEEESGNVKGGLSDPPQAGFFNRPGKKITPSSYKIEGPEAWNLIPSINENFISWKRPFEEIAVNAPDKTLSKSTGSSSVPNCGKKNQHIKSFYYGVVVAPDVSTIKNQEVRKMGYSAGLLAGYRINGHWSVEAGVLWSEKKYYTDGKYFNKTKPQIPDYVRINWVDGECNMFEFPILARYNFTKKDNTFFATAGLTSYIMKKEDYDYSAEAGAGNTTYEGYKSYNRSGDHLFANMQLSAGYNYGLSRKLNIRIEPYLKLPLKKIGIGQMPITSTGLYLGLTRNLQ